MYNDRVRSTNSQQSTGQSCNHRLGGSRLWTAIGGAAIALAVIAVATNFSDIRRYARMVRM